MDYKKILGDAWTEELEKALKKAVGDEFVLRSDFNTTNDEAKRLKDTLKERDGQLEDLKKVDAEGLQAKIETLQTENKEAQKKFDAALAQVQKDNAIEAALVAAKAKNTKAVKALLDMDKITLDGQNLKGLDDLIKALKGSDGFLFAADGPPKFRGAKPGESRDDLPDGALAEYDARLAEARKKGDTLAAIEIKQEAAGEGVILA